MRRLGYSRLKGTGWAVRVKLFRGWHLRLAAVKATTWREVRAHLDDDEAAGGEPHGDAAGASSSGPLPLPRSPLGEM